MTPQSPTHVLRTRTRRLAWTCCALVALAAAGTAHAALWKWTDANGRVVYSDIPPAGDIKAERMSGPSAPANPNAAKDLVNQEADFKKRQLQRTEASDKADKATVEAARRHQACGEARAQIKALSMDEVQHVKVNERGERTIMDAGMRKQESERLQTFVRTQCQGDR